MEAKRKGDVKRRIRFGSDRMFRDSDKWFFYTREGTIEGPFTEQMEARHQLNTYIDMMVSRLAGELSLAPRGLADLH